MSSAIQRLIASLEQGGDRSTFVYDISGWETLDDETRGEVQAWLVARVTRHKDTRAMASLAEMEARGALPSIEGLCSDANRLVRNEAMRAVARLTGNAADIHRLASAQREASGLSSMKTAYHLQKVPGDAATEALFELLYAPSYLTRLHAKNGLVKRLGVDERLLSSPETPLRTSMQALLHQYPSVYRAEAPWLERMLRALSRNDDAAALGLVYVPGDPSLVERVWASAKLGRRSSEPYDTDAISSMTGHDRAWAEVHLLGGLDYPSDYRALGAIVSLKLTHLLPALRDGLATKEASVIPRASEMDPFRDAIRALESHGGGG